MWSITLDQKYEKSLTFWCYIELNVRKEKCFLYKISITKQSIFLITVTKYYCWFLQCFDHRIELNTSILASSMESDNFTNRVKSIICFKGEGSCYYFILIYKRYCHKNKNTLYPGLNEHHHLLFPTLKITFKKERLCNAIKWTFLVIICN